jgi:hypothetical protein
MSRLTDTSDNAHEAQVSVLRDLGPERRSQLAAEWSDEIRRTAMQGIRDRHGDFEDRDVILEYARITLGERLFQEAFAEELTKPK